MRRLPLLLLLALVLPACSSAEQTAEDAADTTADVATDVANTTANVATAAAGAVTDAAGTVWNATTDLFDDDPDAAAAALVRPTTDPGASAEGTVRFRYDGDDLVADVSLRGLAPGAHGMHIHQYPNCNATTSNGQPAPAGASGGHWDPLSTNDHGAPTEEDDAKHLGDLGNIMVGRDGTVETTVTVEGFEPGTYPVSGHALVVHSGRDDLETDPAGGAGTPQGCGVIEARR